MGSWTDHVGSGVIALVGIITAATAFAVGVHSQAPRLRAWRKYDEEAHKTQLTATRHLANFEQIEEKFLWLDKITETREILTFERARDKKSKIPPSFTAETGRSPVTQPLKGVLDSGGGSAQDLHYARNMSKAFFIYDVIQREIRRGRRIKTLCEMGFCAPPHHQHQHDGPSRARSRSTMMRTIAAVTRALQTRALHHHPMRGDVARLAWHDYDARAAARRCGPQRDAPARLGPRRQTVRVLRWSGHQRPSFISGAPHPNPSTARADRHLE